MEQEPIFSQSEYDVRCEWGLRGAEALAPDCDAVVVVDVMSFSTAVAVAVARGAVIFPYRWKDASRKRFAESMRATLAGPRGKSRCSLSPASMEALEPGERVVLPSPNGATISLSTGDTPTFAGCLRNARAVAAAAQAVGPRIGIITCAERWPDGSMRPACEDTVGAGAIIRCLAGTRSPEAEAALAVFMQAEGRLDETLRGCSSGKELIAGGYEADVALAAELDCDSFAPILKNGAYARSDG